MPIYFCLLYFIPRAVTSEKTRMKLQCWSENKSTLKLLKVSFYFIWYVCVKIILKPLLSSVSIETSKNTFSPEEHYKGQRATFQRAMKVTVIVGQCFALNPVLGVSDFDTSNLRFANFQGVAWIFIILRNIIFWKFRR